MCSSRTTSGEQGSVEATSSKANAGASTSADASASSDADASTSSTWPRIAYYTSEHELPAIQALMHADLSEPYSIFTYRYFIHQWPALCFLAWDKSRSKSEAGENEVADGKGANESNHADGGTGAENDSEECVGAVVSKLEPTRRGVSRGYIAMLAVARRARHKGVGTDLVRATVRTMRDRGADEVVLETEVGNAGALRLYANLGFIRDKRLEKYYLNGADAFRLKLRLRSIGPPTFRLPVPPQARSQLNHAGQDGSSAAAAAATAAAQNRSNLAFPS